MRTAVQTSWERLWSVPPHNDASDDAARVALDRTRDLLTAMAANIALLRASIPPDAPVLDVLHELDEERHQMASLVGVALRSPRTIAVGP